MSFAETILWLIYLMYLQVQYLKVHYSSQIPVVSGASTTAIDAQCLKIMAL